MKSLIFTFFAAAILTAGTVHAGEKVRIAIGAEGDSPSAQVSRVGAKSPYFLVFDETGEFLKALENPYRDARRGAGRDIGPFLADKGINFVVAEDFGENMIQGMEIRGIKYMEFQGGVLEALNKVLGGAQ